MRKVFLDELPKKEGIGANKGKMLIDWNLSVGHFVEGVYDDIDFNVQIIEYNKKSSRLKIKYNNKEYDMYSGNFKDCKFGKILKLRTNEFKIEIGTPFKDGNRDIIVIDREYKEKNKNNGNNKYYRCHCNKCGYEYFVVEYSLISSKSGCPRCCNNSNVVVKGINDIATVSPWMIKYFKDKTETYENTVNSHKKVLMKCPDCGAEKMKRIGGLYETKSMGCICSDHISYPEKFMISLLKQLNIEFIKELSKTTFDWCKNYRYDFYIPSLNIIIETHGEQHLNTKNYNRGFSVYKRKDSLSELENDKRKEHLAKENNIDDYIAIDCSMSTMEFIKNEILSSKLSELLDLSKVDWLKCEEFALKNLVKEVCNYYNNNKNMTTTEIGVIFGLTKNTIRKYLKSGTNLKWCNYDVCTEKKKAILKTSNTNRRLYSKKVIVLKDNVEITLFNSLRELEDNSLSVLGIKLNKSQVCIRLNPNNKKYGQLYKGYTFKYVS